MKNSTNDLSQQPAVISTSKEITVASVDNMVPGSRARKRTGGTHQRWLAKRRKAGRASAKAHSMFAISYKRLGVSTLGLMLVATMWGVPPTAKIKNLTCTSPLIIAYPPFPGQTGVCTLTLTKAAPAGGMSFNITAPGATVSAIVTVPQGATSTQFQIIG